jgi:hypothetical protein
VEVGREIMFVGGKPGWKVGIKDGVVGVVGIEVPGRLEVAIADKLDPPMGAVKKDGCVVETLVPLEFAMK